MEKTKVDLFMMSHTNYFPIETVAEVRRTLEALPAEKEIYLQYAELRDPNTALILSLIGLLGVAGFDRFYLGDIGLGVLKLITCGGCYIWTIIDLINVTKDTKQRNYQKLVTAALQ